METKIPGNEGINTPLHECSRMGEYWNGSVGRILEWLSWEDVGMAQLGAYWMYWRCGCNCTEINVEISRSACIWLARSLMYTPILNLLFVSGI